MSMGLSLLWKDRLFDYLLGIDPAEDRFVALLSTAATEDDTGTSIVEVTYTGYTRIEVAAADWTATINGLRSNEAAITFPTPPTDEGEYALGFAVCNAATNGELVGFADFAPAVFLTELVQPKFSIGALAWALLTTTD